MVDLVQVENISDSPSHCGRISRCDFVRARGNQRAWDWGKEVHAGQLRLSGDPILRPTAAG